MHELCEDKQLTEQNRNPVRSDNKTLVMETEAMFKTSSPQDWKAISLSPPKLSGWANDLKGNRMSCYYKWAIRLSVEHTLMNSGAGKPL